MCHSVCYPQSDPQRVKLQNGDAVCIRWKRDIPKPPLTSTYAKLISVKCISAGDSRKAAKRTSASSDVRADRKDPFHG